MSEFLCKIQMGLSDLKADLEHNEQLREAFLNFRVGVHTGLSIIGIDLGGKALNQAMQNGQINKLFGYSEARGYGLISSVQVGIYGT